MLIAAVQTGPAIGPPSDMVARSFELVADAERPDLVVFPELFARPFWCVGLSDAEYFSWAETVEGETVEMAANYAKRLGCHAVVPFFEKGTLDGEYYNSAAVVGPDGELITGVLPGGNTVSVYRKNAISSYSWQGVLNDEKYYFRVGQGFPLFHSEIGKIGVLICYDRWFPEAWRVLALQGAEIVTVVNASTFGSSLFQPSLRTWAAENSVFVVGANRAGTEVLEGHEYSYFGLSCLVSPSGEILASASGNTADEVVRAEVDLNEIRRTRFNRTMYRDRRPELYGTLTQQ